MSSAPAAEGLARRLARATADADEKEQRAALEHVGRSDLRAHLRDDALLAHLRRLAAEARTKELRGRASKYADAIAAQRKADVARAAVVVLLALALLGLAAWLFFSLGRYADAAWQAAQIEALARAQSPPAERWRP